MRKKCLWAVLFAVYLLILFRITVFRSGWYQREWMTGSVVLLPFQTIFSYLTNGQIGYFVYLFVGNLIWFVPFGFYLRLCGVPLLRVLLFTALLSVGIEALQFVFGSGVSEVEDVLLNTVGGGIGCAFAAMIHKHQKT